MRSYCWRTSATSRSSSETRNASSAGGRALEQQVLLAVIAGPGLQHGPRQTQPVCAVVGRDRDDLPKNPHAAMDVIALEGRVGLAPQRGGGFRHLARLGLDLSLQFNRPVGEIVPFERLVGGDGGGRQ